jgi:acyl carrier protein
MSTSNLPPEKIRALLETTFGLQSGELGDDTALFSSGLLDSFHLVEMISVLEKASGRKIKPGEINLENLDTPGSIAGFLSSAS